MLFEALRKMTPDIAVVVSNTENLEKFSEELRLSNVQVKQLVEDGRLSLVEGTDGRGAFLAKTKRFKTVHWFEKKSSKFVWRCTDGGLDFVRNTMKHYDKYQTDNFSMNDSEDNGSLNGSQISIEVTQNAIFDLFNVFKEDNDSEQFSSVDNDSEQSSSEDRDSEQNSSENNDSEQNSSKFERDDILNTDNEPEEISCKENNFVDMINQSSIENRIVVISDDPGKGKSTSLSTFSRRYMELGSHWVIRVNFKEHSFSEGLVHLHTQPLTIESVVKLLSSINRLKINHPLGRHLLTACLRNKERALNKLVFMLDGFDEVPPKIMEKAKILIRFFKEETQSIVFVTTRKHYTTTLEDLCSVFSTRFRNLTDDSIELYITEFFDTHLKHSIINQNYGITNTYDFETYLTNNIEILKFPLLLNITCNILLSNIKQNSVKKFDSFVYPSAFSLFKEYIKIKVESCGEKSDLPLQSYSQPDVFVKQCHEFLGFLAFTEIFPEVKIPGDVVAELADVKHRFLLLGIVQEDFYSGFTAQEKESSNFTFIHRTFCEFYCANFIFNNITNENYKDMLMPVLDKIIGGQLDKEYSLLKQFLNSLLSENFPILNAINNQSELDHICLQYDENVKDLLGRTPLHYAAMYMDKFTIHKLLDNGWVHTVDITGRLPLHYEGPPFFIQSLYHLSPFSSPIRFFNKNIINSWSSVRYRIRPCFYNGKNLLEDITSNENTPLIICVKIGNLPLLKYLCDSDNTNINEPNNEGKTPLHVAAKLGRYNMVRCLVDRGGDVNSRDDELKTPLDYAMQIKNYHVYIKCVKFLFLECGATTTAMSSRDSQVLRDVLTADVNGKNLDSLLTEPFVSKHSHLWEYLQSLGARESLLLAVGCAIPDYSKQILYAVDPRFLISTEYICKTIKRSEPEDILKSILQCTNTPNCDLTANTWEYSPLHFLAYIGDMYQIESLLTNGAKYNVVNRNGHTPAQVYRNHHHRDCGYLRVVEELFKCCNNDDSTRFKEIYEVNSLVFARDSRGRTLLHTAFEAGFVDLVKVILYKWNKDTEFLNAKDDNGQAALHYAAQMGYEDFALQLLYRGADSMCRDRDGRLPADLLRTESTIKYIWRQLCKLFDYYSNGYSDEDEAMSIIDGIQSQGEIPHYLMNLRDCNNNTLLRYAVRNGHLRVVIFILSNGGNYEVGYTWDCSFYEIRRLFEFLSYAFYEARSSYPWIVYKYLVRMLEYADTEDSVKKCILNARNYRGDTLLHCVKDKDLAKWLVNNCKDINIKDVDGKTPLQRAEERNDFRIRIYIIKNEVDRRLAGPSSSTY